MLIGCTLNLSYSQAFHNHVATRSSTHLVKHNKTEQCGVAPLKQQGLTYSDPVDKANILNRQFESVFSNAKKIVSGLRARHFKTSASMFFSKLKKKNSPCFSATKEYVKHFQMLQYCILRRA